MTRPPAPVGKSGALPSHGAVRREIANQPADHFADRQSAVVGRRLQGGGLSRRQEKHQFNQVLVQPR
jgi:hypothetical protein